MVKQIDKNEARLRRHRRVRGKISGTAARPRLDVFRSAKHIYAQIIDDEKGVTLVSASSMDKDFEGAGGNVEAAAKVGKKVAERALELVGGHLLGILFVGLIEEAAFGAHAAAGAEAQPRAGTGRLASRFHIAGKGFRVHLHLFHLGIIFGAALVLQKRMDFFLGGQRLWGAKHFRH